MSVRVIDVFNQFSDNSGNPLSGGKIYTYVPNSTTPLATYTESTGVTQQANPIVLDTDGRPASPIYWTVGSSYKVQLYDSAGVLLDTLLVLDIPAAASAASQYADLVFMYGGGPPAAATAGTTAGWIGGEVVARGINFAANFSGSYGKTLTNPAASFVMTVRKNATHNDNGTQIGTITVSTGGAYTFATTSGATQSLAAGDAIDVFGPATADTTMADFKFTLAGTLA